MKDETKQLDPQEHTVRFDDEDPYVDPCGCCGSFPYSCSCGWSGCLFQSGEEVRQHSELYRKQEED